MKRTLPPLNALRAFESAARNMGFSKAGEELHVSHGAISQQIKILEDWLGIQLFKRMGRHLELTDQGNMYLATVGPALAAIAGATIRLGSRRVVAVNAQPALTMRWLLPRLANFRTLHPDIEVNITTGIEPAEQLPKNLDVIIRRSAHDVEGFARREFLSELSFPVCAPSVLTHLPINNLHSLSRHTLVHSNVRPQAWPDWLRAVGHSNLVPAHALHLEHLYFALQAAVDGLGVAMGTSSLVMQDLLEKRLVMPFGSMIVAGNSYFMLARPEQADRSPVSIFCDWLKQEGARFDVEFRCMLGKRETTSIEG